MSTFKNFYDIFQNDFFRIQEYHQRLYFLNPIDFLHKNGTLTLKIVHIS